MSEHLVVCPTGLQTASAHLQEHSSALTAASMVNLAADRSSTAGATEFSAALDRFSTAYAGRLSDHGRAFAVSASRYADTDGNSAAAVSSVTL